MSEIRISFIDFPRPRVSGTLEYCPYFVSLELEHSTSRRESSDPARLPRESSEQARLLLLLAEKWALRLD